MLLANEIKQGTYRNIGDASYGELSTPSKNVQKDVARGLREEVGAAEPAVVDPLAQEAAAINARDLIGERLGRRSGGMSPYNVVRAAGGSVAEQRK